MTVKTDGKLIALVSILSGIHVRYLHRRDKQSTHVVMTSGERLSGEGIRLTSDQCKYTLDIVLADGDNDTLIVRVLDDTSGSIETVNVIEHSDTTPEKRSELKDTICGILDGVIVYE